MGARRDQPSQAVEELEGGQAERGAAVSGRTRQMVDEAGVGGAQGPVRRGVLQPVKRERGSSTIPEQSLQPGPIMGGDADRAVEAEASGPAPAEHVVGLGAGQQPSAYVESEDAMLDDGGEASGICGVETAGRVKGQGCRRGPW